jgi:hypothetical protein
MAKWFAHDLHGKCKHYIKFEVALIKESYEFIEKFEYFEKLLVDSD